MQIHVGRNGQHLGTFSIEQVRAGLVNGKFQPADIAWHEGMGEWQTLESLPALRQPPPSAPLNQTALPAKTAATFQLPAPETSRSQDVSAKMRTKSRWKLAIVGIGVLILIATAIPTFHLYAPRFDTTKSEHDCTTSGLAILDAIKRHAAKNQGRLPLTLDELVKSGLLADPAHLRCPLHGDDSQPGYLYFGRGMTLAASPDKVVLISYGVNAKGERTVIHLDGQVSREIIAKLPPLR